MKFPHWGQLIVTCDATLPILDQARYARRTANRHLSSIKSFYRWLVVAGCVSSSPAEVIQGPKQGKPLPRVIKQGEMDRLLSVTLAGKNPEDISATDLRDQALLELLYAAGLRVSEASGLLCSQVFMDEALLRVMGKGSKERIVPLHKTACSALAVISTRGACFAEGAQPIRVSFL